MSQVDVAALTGALEARTLAEPSLIDARILVVDDQEPNLLLLRRILEHAGYHRIATVADSRAAFQEERRFEPDLIVLDWVMPLKSGLEVLADLRAGAAHGAYLPVLVLTGDASAETRTQALAAGAQDFLTKPFDRGEVLLRIRNLLLTRRLHQQLLRQNRALEDEIREGTARLLHTEKLATMGELIASMAHELNNPLAVIVGHAGLLQRAHVDLATAARAQLIAEAADRCARIVRNFLSIAQKRPVEHEEVDLHAVVRDALDLMAYALSVDDIAVERDFDPGMPQLWADPHQLHQVMVNLIANAHQALREVRTRRRIRVSTRHDREAERVRIEVSDTGPGIPPDILPRIFDPFFTTKAAGKGTGLGLPISESIVASHGGSLRAESLMPGGARFVVELPAAPVPPPGRRAGTDGSDARAQAVRPRRVLVVDDEPEIAALVADIAALEGHVSDRAASGVEALASLARTSYDLVVSDVRMPGLDGPGLHAEIARHRPEMLPRILFVTGDVLDPELVSFLARTGAAALSKPFTVTEMRRALRRALASES